MTRWSPTLILVAALLAIEGVIYGAIAPLLPEYAADLDLSSGEVGLLVGAYPIGILLGTFPAAAAAGRIGPRLTLLIGLAVVGGASIAFGLLESATPLLVARFIQGCGSAAAWIGGLALLFRSTPSDEKGGAVGTAFGAAVVGLTVGPLIGGLATEVGTEPMFIGLGLVSLALVVWGAGLAVDETAVALPDEAPATAIGPQVALGLWVLCLGSMFTGAMEVLLPLRLEDLAVSGLMIGAIFFVVALLEAVASPQAGRLSDRRGRLEVIGVGVVGIAIVCVGLAEADTVAVIVAFLFSVAFAMAALFGPTSALVSDAAEAAGLGQAKAAGLLNIAFAGGGVAGSLAAGSLASSIDPGAPFLIIAALSLLTLVAVFQQRGALAPNRS